MLIATAIGAAIGYFSVPVTLTAVGLTAAGPVAGSLFAASQGAGVAAGSVMAVA